MGQILLLHRVHWFAFPVSLAHEDTHNEAHCEKPLLSVHTAKTWSCARGRIVIDISPQRRQLAECLNSIDMDCHEHLSANLSKTEAFKLS